MKPFFRVLGIAAALALSSCSINLKNTGPGFGPPGWAPTRHLHAQEITGSPEASPQVEVPVIRKGVPIEIRTARIHITDWNDAPPSKGTDPGYYGLWEGFRDMLFILFYGE